MRQSLTLSLWLAAVLAAGCGHEAAATVEGTHERAPPPESLEAAELALPPTAGAIVRSPADTNEPGQGLAELSANLASFRVQLLDTNGKPVADASVLAALADFDEDIPRYAFGNFDWDHAESHGKILSRAVSGADGWAALPSLPANTRILARIRLTGYTDHQFHAVTPGPTAQRDLPSITLQPGRDVRIRFVDDAETAIAQLEFRGSAPQFVTAEFLAAHPDGVGWLEDAIVYDWPDDEHQGRTDDQGWALLRGLPRQMCAVAVSDPRFVRAEEYFIPIPADVAENTIRLVRGAVLTGRIRQANGQPVVGAELSLADDWSFDEEKGKEGDIDSNFHSSHPRFTKRSEIRSDADGRFALPSGATGDRLASIQAYLHPDLHFAFPLTRKRADLDLVIPNLCHLTGRISGLPDAGQFRLYFWSYRGLLDKGPRTTCDVAVSGEGFAIGLDGRFNFAIPSGTYQMSVHGPGIEHVFFKERRIEQDTDLGDLGMPSGSPVWIEFQMAGLTAAAWKGLRHKIEVRDERAPSGSRDEWGYGREIPYPDVSEAGLLTWPAHPPGHFRITVEIPGFAAAGTDYLVGNSGEKVTANLQLFPCGLVRVQVQNPEESAGNAPLRLSLEPDEDTQQSAGFVFQKRLGSHKFRDHLISVDADGVGLCANLMPGLWRVYALAGEEEERSWAYAETQALGEVTVKSAETAEVSVRLSGFAQMTVVVLDAGGAPVTDASAGISAVANLDEAYSSPDTIVDANGTGPYGSRTDRAGTAAFARVSYGDYLVCAQRDEGSAAAWTKVRVDQPQVACTLRLEGGIVSLVPRRADGSLPAEGEVGLIAEKTPNTPASSREINYSRNRGQVCERDLEDYQPPYVFQDVAPGRYRAYLRVRARYDEIAYGWSEVFEVPASGLAEPIIVIAEDTPEFIWSWTGQAAWDALGAIVYFQREGDSEPWDDYPLWDEDVKPQKVELPLPAGIWTARLVTPDGVTHAVSPPFRHGPGEAPPQPWSLSPPR